MSELETRPHGVHARWWHPYSLPLTLALLPLQAYVLRPHDAWLPFRLVAPPSIVFSIWLVLGLLAVQEPRQVRLTFRFLLCGQLRRVPLILLASLCFWSYITRDPARPHASAASLNLGRGIVYTSWLMAYGIALLTPLPARLPGKLDRRRISGNVRFLMLVIPPGVVVWLISWEVAAFVLWGPDYIR